MEADQWDSFCILSLNFHEYHHHCFMFTTFFCGPTYAKLGAGQTWCYTVALFAKNAITVCAGDLCIFPGLLVLLFFKEIINQMPFIIHPPAIPCRLP